MADECIFCQLLENEEQTLVVHETENFRAWLDINPRAKGHTMVVPKDHLTSAEEVGAMLGEMFEVARIVGEKAMNGLGADGYSVVVNNHESAGQMVDHFYMIVFPRFSEDENAGTPTGAIFRQREDLEKEDLVSFQEMMEDADFNDYSSTPKIETKFDEMRKEEGGDDDGGSGATGSYRKKGVADFR